jgi:hypothetical protein
MHGKALHHSILYLLRVFFCVILCGIFLTSTVLNAAPSLPPARITHVQQAV